MNRTYSTSSKPKILNRTITLSTSYQENVPVFRPVLSVRENVSVQQQPLTQVSNNDNDKNITIIASSAIHPSKDGNSKADIDKIFLEETDLFDTMTINRLNLGIKTFARAHEADAAQRKINLKNHMKNIVAAKAELAKLEKEIVEEESLTRSLQKQTTEVKEKYGQENEKRKNEREKCRQQTLEYRKEVENLTLTIKEFHDRESIRLAIIKCFNVDSSTLCCPEGKKVLPEGDVPPECDILKCPAVRKELS